MAARSRQLGTRRGLELWRHLYAQNKGVGPEQIQRIVADLLTPVRTTSEKELYVALLKFKEQLREVIAGGT